MVKAAAVGLTAGSGRNVPELSYNPLEDLGYVKWMSVDNQPSDWTNVKPLPAAQQFQATRQEAAATQQRIDAAQAPKSSAPASPSEGLADRLN